MKIIIIEDEFYAAQGLAKMILDARPAAEIVRMIGSVEEAIHYFTLNPEPDLLFCDIHLSDGICFEIFESHSLKCPVVFTTAFNQYAIQAFEVNSIDYLLKPIRPEALMQTLKKYEQHYSYPAINFKAVQKILEKPAYKTRFSVKIGQNIQIVQTEKIAYFQAQDGLVFILTFDSKRYITEYTLEQLEGLLDSNMFFRVNRQLILHVQTIKKVAPYFKGRLLLHLLPELGEKQTVSQLKTAKFKAWMGA